MIASEHDRGGWIRSFANGADEVDPIPVRQSEVEDDRVEDLNRKQGSGNRHRLGAGESIATHSEHGAECVPSLRVVLDDQDVWSLRRVDSIGQWGYCDRSLTLAVKFFRILGP